MKRQQGSILGLFLVLSVVLTTGAAGLLLTTGAWDSDRINTLERRALLQAAETGLAMGARWMRQEINIVNFDTYQQDDGVEKPVTPGGYIELNGALVKVTYVFRADPGAVFLVSRATLPSCIQTLQLEWRIESVGARSFYDGAIPLSEINFSGWSENSAGCDYTIL